MSKTALHRRIGIRRSLGDFRAKALLTKKEIFGKKSGARIFGRLRSAT